MALPLTAKSFGYCVNIYERGKESRSMMKAFKYRLYPTRKQADALQQTLDLCRELYNAALQERKEAWRMTAKVAVQMVGTSAVMNYAKPIGTSISYEDQSAQLPEIKDIRPEYKEIY